MIIKEPATRLFQYVAIDNFDFNNQQFLLIADQYSKMAFIKTLKNTTSLNCIEYFKAIFAVHSIPERLYTDNARSFVSNEFHNFATEWEFTHITHIKPQVPTIKRIYRTHGSNHKKKIFVRANQKWIVKWAFYALEQPQLTAICLPWQKSYTIGK